MMQGKKLRNMTAGLSALFVMSTLFGILPSQSTIHAVYAADASTPLLSKEQVTQLAQKWGLVPADFKQINAAFKGPERSPYFKQSWSLSWTNAQENARVNAVIDAVTGELLQYSRYTTDGKTSGTIGSVGEKQALENAMVFLQRVTSEAERKRLSKPNEYAALNPYYTEWPQQVFMFTRIEKGIPFLENGIQLVLDEAGQVILYAKDWNNEDLPDPEQALLIERAQNAGGERITPTLSYKVLESITGNFDRDNGKFALVYAYGQKDPQYVDALTGKVINALGQNAEETKPLQPLGKTVLPASKDKVSRLITKEEAQGIAEQLIKKLPGQYLSEGSRGGGSSSGPNGVQIRNWKFDFSPVQSKDRQAETVQLRINDRGQLEEVMLGEGSGRGGQKIEKAVAWKEAVAGAIQLVKTFYSDRLGEIYLLDEQPSDLFQQEQLRRGSPFMVEFGWMKDGVPIENKGFFVEVNPETGIAESLQANANDLPDLAALKVAKTIDPTEARKVEQAQKKWMLTYFQPQPGNKDLPKSMTKPMLVYRYVGDKGVVDALTGKWISFDAERKKQRPEDLAGHPYQEALEYVVRNGFMTVEEGKLLPDKQVTRMEMAQWLSRLTTRIEFHDPLRLRAEDEEKERFEFEDVTKEHSHYAVIQKGLQYGFIAKQGTKFEPDLAITRAQAADMAARLLGYGDLLNKPGIFQSVYPDVLQQDIPAVTIVHALGLIEGKTKTAFSPNDPLTRGEAAQLLQDLIQLRQGQE
jgi:hypothetical protein